VLGGRLEEDDTWVVLTEPTGRRLAFERAPEHEPPRFPDPRGSQQFHLDIQVDNVDSAEREVLALGATRVTDAVEDNLFRVYRDPAGHTFCLVWGITD
jgi:Glyoxalase-like domain